MAQNGCKTLAVLTLLSLGGCGGGGGGGEADAAAPATASVSGRAAVGAPIAGAPVTALCSDDSGFLDPVVTDASGFYRGEVLEAALPCALRVDGGELRTRLHSFVSDPDVTTNITSLTDLAIAMSSGLRPTDWFGQANRAARVGQLQVAIEQLLAALRDAGYPVPAGDFDPLNDPFAIQDPGDRLLDALTEALAESPSFSDYQTLIDTLRDGNLNVLPRPPGAGPGPGGDGSADGDAGGGAGGDSDGGGGDAGGDSGGSGGDGAGDDGLAACRGPLPMAGDVFRQVDRIREGDTVIEGASVNELMFNGPMPFQGQILDEFRSTSFAADGSVSSVIDSYRVPTTDPGFESIVASVARDVSGLLGGDQTTLFEPPLTLDFDLAVGQSHVSNSTQDTRGSLGEFSFAVEQEMTYLGRETITVPGGTFAACRVRMRNLAAGSEVTQEVWFGVDNGLRLRSRNLAESRVTEFVSATRNGQPLP